MEYIEIDENADLTPGAIKLLQAIEAVLQVKITGIPPGNTTVMTVVKFTPSFLASGMWVGRLDYCLKKDPHAPGSIRCAMLEGTGATESGWGKLDTVQHLLSTRQWRSPDNPNVTVVNVPPPAPPGRCLIAIEVDGPGWGRLE